MEQRSLRVVETNKTFFSKVANVLTRMLIPAKIGINNILISIKRNSVVKAYLAYQSEEDTTKKEFLSKKYENNYALYLESIDKYIMDSVYRKVKNNTATPFEREHLSKYYLVVSLKEKNYLEYKYRKQEYLLGIDYETASTIKKEVFLKQYKEFYISKMDAIYRGLLKNYAIKLIENNDEIKDVYEKIFNTLEDYVSILLPIKMEQMEDADLADDYDKYETSIIGKLDKRDIIFKKVNLLNISRHLFTHSLPLSAIEKCYETLLREVRDMIVDSQNDIKQNKAYQTLFDLMEEYNLKVLSTKVYWEIPQERENYKKFWDKYSKAVSNEQEEILVLKYDLKKLDSSKNKQIRALYKEKLVKMGAMKCIKNIPKTNIKTYKECKVKQ